MWRPESVYDGKGHLDEGVIHAWLDGALERDAAREVEAHAESCVTCSARVSEARGLIAGASRVLGALDVVPGVARSVAPDSTSGVVEGVAQDSAADIARRSLTVDAGIATSNRKPRRWWATRTMGLAAAAVFIFAAGSVVLRDQLGGGGGVREAVMADRAPITERSTVTSESEFAAPVPAPAPAPASAEPGGAAPRATAGGGGGAATAAAPSRVAAPDGVQPPVAALEVPRAQAAEQQPARGATPAPVPVPLALGAPALSPPLASDQAAEPARRREVASNKVAAASRVATRAPAEAVHLRGQVATADSTTRADSAIRRRWQDAAMNLESVVVSSMPDRAKSGYVGWGGRCWRHAGSDTLYRFLQSHSAFDQSARPDSTAVQASGRGRSVWTTGERLVGDSLVGTFEWLEERDGSGVRIRTPGIRGELRLRAVGDSLLEGRIGRGQRVRLEALSGCP